jgi:hypothetical protein
MSTVNLIEKFCSTLDTKYLEKIPKEYQVLFQKSSVKALEKNNTNNTVANKVLQYFNLKEDGTIKFEINSLNISYIHYHQNPLLVSLRKLECLM